MSPEQTGRLSQTVDMRADLYSLGVSFYQLLSGQLPFEANSPLEWVHCHLARSPVPLHDRVHAVPPILGDIVQRLLAKMADDRYQTASSLLADLQECWSRWQDKGSIEPFPLEQVGYPLRPPGRLFGRERELGLLADAFRGMVKSVQGCLVLVRGPAGVGKSALVRAMEHLVTSAHGYFLPGKYEQFQAGRSLLNCRVGLRRLAGSNPGQQRERTGALEGRTGGHAG
jgi:hypothetical protein